ncbi:MAG: hypothetical protein V2I62_01970 [Bacteroidales bacterium]|jgi:hypothetical protein|nr:hypothetical protein [Bacteroidales bacterium]
MKHIRYSIILFLFISIGLYSQHSCKVLVPEIAEKYVGKCKKGLAHGKGLAIGIDRYEGSFKKGYPEGKGTYTWSTGEVFTGEWLNGKRNGTGTYTFTEDGQLMEQEGVWKDDVYKGPVPEKPQVLRSSGIERYSIQKQGDDANQVTINFFLNGKSNTDLEDFSISPSSGTVFRSAGSVGVENIVFPFSCKLYYRSLNKTFTSRVNTTFEFKISEKGRWTLKLHNN